MTVMAIAFVDTREHHRFTEFADTVRAAGYIGLCHGRPGVGKTLSARRYAGWDELEPYLERYRFKDYETTPRSATRSRALVYTPKVHTTPKSLDKDLTSWHERLSWAVESVLHPGRAVSDLDSRRGRFAELVIVDEADRLSTSALEQLRDHHDRTGIGVILIGMSGIEKRLSRYPQLYSRVGFVHQYRELGPTEQAQMIAEQWPHLHLQPGSETCAQTLAAITRITSGNFRFTRRLMAQIERILDINDLDTVTTDVVAAARETLVIGIA